MTSTKPETQTRQHQHVLEIAASPEDVWKTITEAAELVRWFPLQAEVLPQAGGHITYAWGDLVGRCSILEWHPVSHLKTSWMQAPSTGAESSAVAVDWFLEGSGGKTRLRLVHSGFGAGAEWDEEFNGTNRGWKFELYSLKHYLENHRGTPRRSFWLRRDVAAAAPETWERFVSRLAPGRQFAAAEVGQSLRISFSSGDVAEGTLLCWAPPNEVSMTAENWNRGLLRLGIENCGAGPQALIWVSLWDVPEEQAAALRERFETALDQAVAAVSNS
jgi:uncharacterized protein YndB with AHSA1/START domain